MKSDAQGAELSPSMEVCRACGESSFPSQCDRTRINELTDIYYKLTGIQLFEMVEPAQLLFCIGCTVDLNHFDRFRKKCLEVYQRLYSNLKVEAWQESFDPVTVKVEPKEEPSVVFENESAVVATENNKEDIEEFDAKPPVEGERSIKQEDGSSDDDAENDDDDDNDDGGDDDDGIGVGSGDDNGDNGSEDEDSEFELESNKNISKKRIRNRNGSPRPKGRPRKRPADPNKKPPIKFINCPQCPKRFVFEHRLEAHLRVHDGQKPFLCKLCGKSFKKFHAMKLHHIKKHTDTHADTKISLPCGFPGCDLVFTTQEGVKRHRLRVHDPNYKAPEQIPFICDICGKSYSTNGELKTHRYIHNPEEMPFPCSICGKKFPTRTKINIHMKRHQGIKDFECPQCGLRKPSQSEVTQHIKKVHEKHLRTEKISCTACDTKFCSKATLKRHVDVVHLKIKRFICSVCGFMFSQKDHLNRHMKSHKAKDIDSVPIVGPLQSSD